MSHSRIVHSLILIAHSESCQFSYEYDVNTLTIQTTWRRVFVSDYYVFCCSADLLVYVCS